MGFRAENLGQKVNKFYCEVFGENDLTVSGLVYREYFVKVLIS